jgi:hypothetical protein
LSDKNRKLACFAPKRKGAKNTKFIEARNPKCKQFQMTKICQIPNELPWGSAFRIFDRVLVVSEFVSDFDIRTLDLFRRLVSDVEPSLDDLIRPLKHAVRNRQTNPFCRLKIYDGLKLCRLVHRQISRFGTFSRSCPRKGMEYGTTRVLGYLDFAKHHSSTPSSQDAD